MPSPRLLAKIGKNRYDPTLPPPVDFATTMTKHPMVVLSGLYGVTMEQIAFWRDQMLQASQQAGGASLPSARGVAPEQATAFQQALVRWRRAHSNVFPVSIHIDDGRRMTWADRWNLTAEKLGRPRIPDRGCNWWWVEGRGLVEAADLLEGP